MCQSLKSGEAIASEAKPSTGHASLKNVSQAPPAIAPSQPAPVRLRQPPFPPAKTLTQASESHSEKRKASAEEGSTPKKQKVHVPLSETECHCGLQFVDQDALAAHVNADHKGGVWKCSQSGCTKIYRKPVVLGHTTEPGTARSLDIIVTCAHLTMMRQQLLKNTNILDMGLSVT